MSTHSHDFVETYAGLVGYGLDRETDEATVKVYLQKFADDACLGAIIPRLGDDELTQVFDLLSGFLRRHLSETEYHRLFLKEEHGHED